MNSLLKGWLEDEAILSQGKYIIWSILHQKMKKLRQGLHRDLMTQKKRYRSVMAIGKIIIQRKQEFIIKLDVIAY